jgi:hypothetical protein
MDDEMFKGVQKYCPAKVKIFMRRELDERAKEMVLESNFDKILRK